MAFWKPGTSGPNQNVETSTINAGKQYEFDTKLLSVYKYKQRILYLLQEYNVVIVAGDTGTGKSSQIPHYLHESGYSKHGRQIGVINDDLKSISSCKLQADQLNTFVGGKVGFKTSFDDTLSHSTEIKFLSPKILLQEVLVDPILSEYSVLMLDDIQDAKFEMELILSILKKIIRKRQDLRILLVMNSVQNEYLMKYFGIRDIKSIALNIETRTYPINELFLENGCGDYLNEAIRICTYIHENEFDGDIMVFLNTKEEIETLATMLLDQGTSGIQVIPIVNGNILYRSLVGNSEKSRAIIISSEFVEFSRIAKVKYVVDTGYQTFNLFNYKKGLFETIKVATSVEMASRRASLAGICGPGKCFRLYQQNEKAIDTDMPSIYSYFKLIRTDLTFSILFLKALGVKNVLTYDFVHKPSAISLSHSMEVKYN